MMKTYLAFHGICVELANVWSRLLHGCVADVQVVLAPVSVLADADPVVVRDHVLTDGLDGLGVSLYPTNLSKQKTTAFLQREENLSYLVLSAQVLTRDCRDAIVVHL